MKPAGDSHGRPGKGATAVDAAARSLRREEARQGSHCVSVLSLNPRESQQAPRGSSAE